MPKKADNNVVSASWISQARDVEILKRLLETSSHLESLAYSSSSSSSSATSAADSQQQQEQKPFENDFLAEMLKRPLLRNPNQEVRIVVACILGDILRLTLGPLTSVQAANLTGAVGDSILPSRVYPAWKKEHNAEVLNLFIDTLSAPVSAATSAYRRHVLETLSSTHALIPLIRLAKVNENTLNQFFNALLLVGGINNDEDEGGNQNQNSKKKKNNNNNARDNNNNQAVLVDDSLASYSASAIADIFTAGQGITQDQVELLISCVHGGGGAGGEVINLTADGGNNNNNNNNNNEGGKGSGARKIAGAVFRRRELSDSIQGILCNVVGTGFDKLGEEYHQIEIEADENSAADKKAKIKQASVLVEKFVNLCHVAPVAVGTLLPMMAQCLSTLQSAEVRLVLARGFSRVFSSSSSSSSSFSSSHHLVDEYSDSLFVIANRAYQDHSAKVRVVFVQMIGNVLVSQAISSFSAAAAGGNNNGLMMMSNSEQYLWEQLMNVFKNGLQDADEHVRKASITTLLDLPSSAAASYSLFSDNKNNNNNNRNKKNKNKDEDDEEENDDDFLLGAGAGGMQDDNDNKNLNNNAIMIASLMVDRLSTEILVEQVGSRCADRKLGVRGTAMEKLARFYQQFRSSHPEKTSWIPTRIFRVAHVEGDSGTVAAILEKLLPNPNRLAPEQQQQQEQQNQNKKGAANKKQQASLADFGFGFTASLNKNQNNNNQNVFNNNNNQNMKIRGGNNNNKFTFVEGFITLMQDIADIDDSAVYSHFGLLVAIMGKKRNLRQCVYNLLACRDEAKEFGRAGGAAEGSVEYEDIRDKIQRYVNVLNAKTGISGEEWTHLFRLKDERAVNALKTLSSSSTTSTSATGAAAAAAGGETPSCTDFASAREECRSRLATSLKKDLVVWAEEVMLPALAFPFSHAHVAELMQRAADVREQLKSVNYNTDPERLASYRKSFKSIMCALIAVCKHSPHFLHKVKAQLVDWVIQGGAKEQQNTQELDSAYCHLVDVFTLLGEEEQKLIRQEKQQQEEDDDDEDDEDEEDSTLKFSKGVFAEKKREIVTSLGRFCLLSSSASLASSAARAIITLYPPSASSNNNNNKKNNNKKKKTNNNNNNDYNHNNVFPQLLSALSDRLALSAKDTVQEQVGRSVSQIVNGWNCYLPGWLATFHTFAELKPECFLQPVLASSNNKNNNNDEEDEDEDEEENVRQDSSSSASKKKSSSPKKKTTATKKNTATSAATTEIRDFGISMSESVVYILTCACRFIEEPLDNKQPQHQNQNQQKQQQQHNNNNNNIDSDEACRYLIHSKIAKATFKDYSAYEMVKCSSADIVAEAAASLVTYALSINTNNAARGLPALRTTFDNLVNALRATSEVGTHLTIGGALRRWHIYKQLLRFVQIPPLSTTRVNLAQAQQQPQQNQQQQQQQHTKAHDLPDFKYEFLVCTFIFGESCPFIRYKIQNTISTIFTAKQHFATSPAYADLRYFALLVMTATNEEQKRAYDAARKTYLEPAMAAILNRNKSFAEANNLAHGVVGLDHQLSRNHCIEYVIPFLLYFMARQSQFYDSERELSFPSFQRVWFFFFESYLKVHGTSQISFVQDMLRKSKNFHDVMSLATTQKELQEEEQNNNARFGAGSGFGGEVNNNNLDDDSAMINHTKEMADLALRILDALLASKQVPPMSSYTGPFFFPRCFVPVTLSCLPYQASLTSFNLNNSSNNASSNNAARNYLSNQIIVNNTAPFKQATVAANANTPLPGGGGLRSGQGSRAASVSRTNNNNEFDVFQNKQLQLVGGDSAAPKGTNASVTKTKKGAVAQRRSRSPSATNKKKKVTASAAATKKQANNNNNKNKKKKKDSDDDDEDDSSDEDDDDEDTSSSSDDDDDDDEAAAAIGKKTPPPPNSANAKNNNNNKNKNSSTKQQQSASSVSADRASPTSASSASPRNHRLMRDFPEAPANLDSNIAKFIRQMCSKFKSASEIHQVSVKELKLNIAKECNVKMTKELSVLIIDFMTEIMQSFPSQ